MSNIRKPGKRGGGRPGNQPWMPGEPRSKDARPGRRGPVRGAPQRGNPRAMVMGLLAVQVKRFPDLDLVTPKTDDFDARDAAFAHALYEMCVRRWLTLRFLATRALDKEWESLHPRIQAALLAGTAQIVLMDKVPVHAAVDESVEWLKPTLGPRAGGLVNAVLRRVGELVGESEKTRRPQWNDDLDAVPMPDGSALVLTKPVMPRDPLERLSVATSHPLELLRLWTKSMPTREVRKLAIHGLATPPVILNTAHAQSPLPSDVTPHVAPGHHVYTGTHDELSRLLAQRRDIWVQDPASSLAVQSVSDLRPKLVVDACAGMGTKTRQLAATFPDAQIIATDIDLPRREELRGVFANHPQVRVADHRKLIEWAGQADLVLLDVPCSNSGVLARRPEARYRTEEKRTESLLGTQRQIIADSLPLVVGAKQRGRILYSTCSLDPRENEEQARWVVRWHSLSVARENRRLPEGGPGEPVERYSDGSYAALIE